MEMFESRRYRVMERITNLMLLNAAWVMASLPIVTVFPATAALFATVRDLQRDGEAGVLASFGRHFRENFRQAMAVGLVWLGAGAVLLFDYLLLAQLPVRLQMPLFVIFSLGAVAFSLTSVYLFPVLVGYQDDWRSVIRNSFFISISQLHTSLACLLVLFAAGFLAAQLPITLLLTTSTTAYVVHAVCARGLGRVQGIRTSVI